MTKIHRLNLDISPKSSRRVGFPLNGLRIPFLANIENGQYREDAVHHSEFCLVCDTNVQNSSKKRETFLGKVKRDSDYSLRKI